MKNEILVRKNENSLLQYDILQEENDSLLIKDKIRTMNKLITSIQVYHYYLVRKKKKV